MSNGSLAVNLTLPTNNQSNPDLVQYAARQLCVELLTQCAQAVGAGSQTGVLTGNLTKNFGAGVTVTGNYTLVLPSS